MGRPQKEDESVPPPGGETPDSNDAAHLSQLVSELDRQDEPDDALAAGIFASTHQSPEETVATYSDGTAQLHVRVTSHASRAIDPRHTFTRGFCDPTEGQLWATGVGSYSLRLRGRHLQHWMYEHTMRTRAQSLGNDDAHVYRAVFRALQAYNLTRLDALMSRAEASPKPKMHELVRRVRAERDRLALAHVKVVLIQKRWRGYHVRRHFARIQAERAKRGEDAEEERIRGERTRLVQVAMTAATKAALQLARDRQPGTWRPDWVIQTRTLAWQGEQGRTTPGSIPRVRLDTTEGCDLWSERSNDSSEVCAMNAWGQCEQPRQSGRLGDEEHELSWRTIREETPYLPSPFHLRSTRVRDGTRWVFSVQSNVPSDLAEQPRHEDTDVGWSAWCRDIPGVGTPPTNTSDDDTIEWNRPESAAREASNWYMEALRAFDRAHAEATAPEASLPPVTSVEGRPKPDSLRRPTSAVRFASNGASSVDRRTAVQQLRRSLSTPALAMSQVGTDRPVSGYSTRTAATDRSFATATSVPHWSEIHRQLNDKLRGVAFNQTDPLLQRDAFLGSDCNAPMSWTVVAYDPASQRSVRTTLSESDLRRYRSTSSLSDGGCPILASHWIRQRLRLATWTVAAAQRESQRWRLRRKPVVAAYDSAAVAANEAVEAFRCAHRAWVRAIVRQAATARAAQDAMEYSAADRHVPGVRRSLHPLDNDIPEPMAGPGFIATDQQESFQPLEDSTGTSLLRSKREAEMTLAETMARRDACRREWHMRKSRAAALRSELATLRKKEQKARIWCIAAECYAKRLLDRIPGVDAVRDSTVEKLLQSLTLQWQWTPAAAPLSMRLSTAPEQHILGMWETNQTLPPHWLNGNRSVPTLRRLAGLPDGPERHLTPIPPSQTVMIRISMDRIRDGVVQSSLVDTNGVPHRVLWATVQWRDHTQILSLTPSDWHCLRSHWFQLRRPGLFARRDDDPFSRSQSQRFDFGRMLVAAQLFVDMIAFYPSQQDRACIPALDWVRTRKALHDLLAPHVADRQWRLSRSNHREHYPPTGGIAVVQEEDVWFPLAEQAAEVMLVPPRTVPGQCPSELLPAFERNATPAQKLLPPSARPAWMHRQPMLPALQSGVRARSCTLWWFPANVPSWHSVDPKASLGWATIEISIAESPFAMTLRSCWPVQSLIDCFHEEGPQVQSALAGCFLTGQWNSPEVLGFLLPRVTICPGMHQWSLRFAVAFRAQLSPEPPLWTSWQQFWRSRVRFGVWISADGRLVARMENASSESTYDEWRSRAETEWVIATLLDGNVHLSVETIAQRLELYMLPTMVDPRAAAVEPLEPWSDIPRQRTQVANEMPIPDRDELWVSLGAATTDSDAPLPLSSRMEWIAASSGRITPSERMGALSSSPPFVAWESDRQSTTRAGLSWLQRRLLSAPAPWHRGLAALSSESLRFVVPLRGEPVRIRPVHHGLLPSVQRTMLEAEERVRDTMSRAKGCPLLARGEMDVAEEVSRLFSSPSPVFPDSGAARKVTRLAASWSWARIPPPAVRERWLVHAGWRSVPDESRSTQWPAFVAIYRTNAGLQCVARIGFPRRDPVAAATNGHVPHIATKADFLSQLDREIDAVRAKLELCMQRACQALADASGTAGETGQAVAADMVRRAAQLRAQESRQVRERVAGSCRQSALRDWQRAAVGQAPSCCAAASSHTGRRPPPRADVPRWASLRDWSMVWLAHCAQTRGHRETVSQGNERDAAGDEETTTVTQCRCQLLALRRWRGMASVDVPLTPSRESNDCLPWCGSVGLPGASPLPGWRSSNDEPPCEAFSAPARSEAMDDFRDADIHSSPWETVERATRSLSIPLDHRISETVCRNGAESMRPLSDRLILGWDTTARDWGLQVSRIRMTGERHVSSVGGATSAVLCRFLWIDSSLHREASFAPAQMYRAPVAAKPHLSLMHREARLWWAHRVPADQAWVIVEPIERNVVSRNIFVLDVTHAAAPVGEANPPLLDDSVLYRREPCTAVEALLHRRDWAESATHWRPSSGRRSVLLASSIRPLAPPPDATSQHHAPRPSWLASNRTTASWLPARPELYESLVNAFAQTVATMPHLSTVDQLAWSQPVTSVWHARLHEFVPMASEDVASRTFREFLTVPDERLQELRRAFDALGPNHTPPRDPSDASITTRDSHLWLPADGRTVQDVFLELREAFRAGAAEAIAEAWAARTFALPRPDGLQGRMTRRREAATRWISRRDFLRWWCSEGIDEHLVAERGGWALRAVLRVKRTFRRG